MEEHSNYEVGFARPPKATQFKEGNKGPRPATKAKRPPTFKEIVDRALERKMRVKIDGKRETLKVGEAIVRKMYLGIAKGDLGYIDLVLAMAAHLKKSGSFPSVEVVFKP